MTRYESKYEKRRREGQAFWRERDRAQMMDELAKEAIEHLTEISRTLSLISSKLDESLIIQRSIEKKLAASNTRKQNNSPSPNRIPAGPKKRCPDCGTPMGPDRYEPEKYWCYKCKKRHS